MEPEPLVDGQEVRPGLALEVTAPLWESGPKAQASPHEHTS